MRPEEEIRRIEVYIHDRYVLGETVEKLDESEAARTLEQYYARREDVDDPNCGYAGILWFEISFADHEDTAACLERADHWLRRAQALSETPWEAVEERLADLPDLIHELS